jgi:hypothetical protein
LAGDLRFTEFASRSLRSRELQGLPVWRTTFELRLIWQGEGRRFTVYVPEDLVPEVRRCLDNGRALQELLFEAALRYVKALKEQRAKPSKKVVG